MQNSLLKQPSASVPLALSLASLALVIGHAVLFGTAPEADEGAAAHLFQIMMVAQVPFVAVFAYKWLPHRTKAALTVLGLHVGAAAVAFAAVYFLT